jgi:hypothetical protein
MHPDGPVAHISTCVLHCNSLVVIDLKHNTTGGRLHGTVPTGNHPVLAGGCNTFHARQKLFGPQKVSCSLGRREGENVLPRCHFMLVAWKIWTRGRIHRSPSYPHISTRRLASTVELISPVCLDVWTLRGSLRAGLARRALLWGITGPVGMLTDARKTGWWRVKYVGQSQE